MTQISRFQRYDKREDNELSLLRNPNNKNHIPFIYVLTDKFLEDLLHVM